MCGIAGFINSNSKYKRENIEAMCNVMKSRGPDGAGVWLENDGTVAFGHRRLSVLDLTDGGAQPMLSRNLRYVITYNGEIYNFADIRSELVKHGISFRGTSDTEVLLEAIVFWGLEKTLEKISGMYAIALYDREKRTLFLVRDRIGEKPLYYGFVNGNFVFSSVLNAIYALKDFHRKIDYSALKLYFQHGYIPTPWSVYEGIYKLEPGTVLTIREPYKAYEVHSYWDSEKIALYGQTHPYQGSFEDATNELETLLKKTIQRQLVADVPVGAFLSGGIDSTLVVALAQSISSKKLKTFSIGFSNVKFNEAVYAAESAIFLGTDHTELYITDEDAKAVLPNIPVFYGEPFADSSQIPTYLVSKLARESVTVSLSGDGGDELFCGYNNYNSFPKLWKKISTIPYFLRKLMYPLTASEIFQWNRRIHDYSKILYAKSAADLYRLVFSNLTADALLPEVEAAEHKKYNGFRGGTLPTPEDDIMLLDLMRYHPDDILVKVDRSAMAVSLESRIPFLDKDVVTFAWSLPLAYKKMNGSSKRVLKSILYRYIPEEKMDRPKKGFSIPMAEWMKGPLRGWAEDLLSEERIREQGILDPKIVQKVWNSFVKQGAYASLVWSLLVFQEWANKYPLSSI